MRELARTRTTDWEQRFPNQSEVIAHIDNDQPMLGGHHEK